MYQGFGQLPSSLALARLQGQEEAPYTVADFGMFVEVSKRRVHDFTQISSNSRLSDLNVSDTTSWHKQCPEFNFHRTDEFKNHHVLVCDASIKVMTMERPAGAELSITFDLCSQIDLSTYDSLECRTRFFENGKPADQMDGQGRKLKQTRTPAEYYVEHGGLMRVKFGSKFWAHQMQKFGDLLGKVAQQEEQSARVRYEAVVRRELQYMTAAQDIYGYKDGEAKCFLTILWRFNQTRSSHEPGRMTWRAANFGHPRERRWVKEEELEEIKNAKALVPLTGSSTTALSVPTSATSIYPSLPLEFNQTFGQPPSQLDLDTLALESMASDFSNPNSATAPSLATDYSQKHSIHSLAHSHDTGATHAPDFHDANEFDFNGGHITISGCLEPTINMSAYDYSQTHPQNLSALSAIAGLEPDVHTHPDNSFSSLGLDVGGSMANCYATKPSWHHPSLISHLESAAEQYNDLMVQGNHVGNVVGHGVLHDGQMNQGLWKLQSAFGEDTGVGADHRKDSVVTRAEAQGHGLLEAFDGRREQRYSAY